MTPPRWRTYDSRRSSPEPVRGRGAERGALPRNSCEGSARQVTEVFVGETESFEAALKRFNKRVQADGILSEARRAEYYEKPSVRRKKKEAARLRKLRKAMRAQAKQRR